MYRNIELLEIKDEDILEISGGLTPYEAGYATGKGLATGLMLAALAILIMA